jgi:hypothetical protein
MNPISPELLAMLRQRQLAQQGPGVPPQAPSGVPPQGMAPPMPPPTPVMPPPPVAPPPVDPRQAQALEASMMGQQNPASKAPHGGGIWANPPVMDASAEQPDAPQGGPDDQYLPLKKKKTDDQ